jgi:DNA recombination protein Rad52
MPTPFNSAPDNPAVLGGLAPPAVPAVATAADLRLCPRVFSEDQVNMLSAPLDAQHVKTRNGYSYFPGWHVINEANRIFGFDGWNRETTQVQCVVDCQRTVGSNSKPGWGVTYLARVRITVIVDGETIIRDGTGAGNGIDADRGIAHEKAIKEAETDAMKRGLVTFGNAFGLALYDKSQRQVAGNATAAPADPFAPLGHSQAIAPGESAPPHGWGSPYPPGQWPQQPTQPYAPQPFI